MQEEIDNMNHNYGGIKNMVAKPGAVFVVDALNDHIAIKEARKLGVPVVALIDTNADPSMADYPIPANDDAAKAINLILDYVQAAIEAGKKKQAKPADKPETAAEKPAEQPEKEILKAVK
jgi:small subunit ribosomal protein S2